MKQTCEEQETGEYSSGLSSDGDLDMMTEVEVLKAQKAKVFAEKQAKLKKNSMATNNVNLDENSSSTDPTTTDTDKKEPKEQGPVSKDDAKAAWVKMLKDMPTNYEF